MQSGNNIHVQQHETNMINEKRDKTQNDAPFVTFYDMSAVTFVLPDEMADDFSRLLQHAIEKGRGPILYSKTTQDPTGTLPPRQRNVLLLTMECANSDKSMIG